MLSLSKFIKKEIELRENLIGTNRFLDPPALEKEPNPFGSGMIWKSDYRVTVLGRSISF